VVGNRHTLSLTLSIVVILVCAIGAPAVEPSIIEELSRLSVERQPHIKRHKAAVSSNDDATAIREAEQIAKIELALVRLCVEHFPRDPGTIDWAEAADKTRQYLVNTYFSQQQFLKAYEHQSHRVELQSLLRGKDDWYVVSQRLFLKSIRQVSEMPALKRTIALSCLKELSEEFYVPLGVDLELLQKSQKLLSQAVDVFGNDSPYVATASHRLAMMHHSRGDYLSAAKAAEHALAIRHKTFGPEAPAPAESKYQLGVARLHQGDYLSAVKLLQESLATRRKIFGDNGRPTLKTQLDLGLALSEQGEHTKAQEHIESARRLANEAFGAEDPLTLECVAETGRLALQQGRWDQGLDLLLLVKQGYLTRKESSQFSLAVADSDLGLAHSEMGHQAASMFFYTAALERLEGLGRTGDAQRATVLNNMAVAYARIGNLPKATKLLNDCLELRRRTLGESHPDTVIAQLNLGGCWKSRGNLSKSEPLLRSARVAILATRGAKHPLTFRSTTGLASVLAGQQKYKQAREMLTPLAASTPSVLGDSHPAYIDALAVLATICEATDDVDAALKYSQLAIRAAEKTGDLRAYVLLMHNVAYLAARRFEFDQASRIFRLSQRSMRAYIVPNVAALSERDQLALLRKFQSQRALASSIALANEDPNVRKRLAECVINGKSLSLEVMGHRISNQRAFDASNSRELVTLRNEYARLVARPDDELAVDKKQRRLDELLRRIEYLSNLGGLGSEYTKLGQRWMELEKVRDALAEDAVLVEFEKFSYLDWKSDDYSQRLDRYIAWIIPPTNSKVSLQAIDLGPAEPLEVAIRNWRRAISQKAGGIDRGVSRIPSSTLESKVAPQEALADLLLKPLLPHLSPFQHWILAPDGALWLTPFAALLLNKETYVIERHVVSYVDSGRTLAIPAIDQPLPDQSYVLANPDYDLEPASPTDSMSRVPQRGADLRKGEAIPRNWAALPGTAKESQAIGPHLESFLGDSLRILTGDEASEAVVKSTARPQVAVFSTHGFFLPPVESYYGQFPELATVDSDPFAPAPVNPLLRCGIVLAGANCPHAEDSEDGILTGWEIASLDLRGTELVVLSACETGVGDIRIGDGVAGVRQAFQLAGAKSVVATLWSVPDQDTAQLMESFWKELAQGESASKAMRNAQLALMRKSGSEGEPSPPYSWAAFTVSGRP